MKRSRLWFVAIGSICIMIAVSALACSPEAVFSKLVSAKLQTSATPGARSQSSAPSPTATPPALAPSIPSTGEIDHGNKAKAQIALTFDAGSGSTATQAILDILKKKGVKATFFLTGKWTDENPEMAKQIVDSGHQVANHSYSHPDFTTLSNEEMQQEIERTESAVLKATGEPTSHYWRPPFGARDSRVIKEVESLGYRDLYWTIDTIDWDPQSTLAAVRSRAVDKASNGAIILMHADSPQTAKILGQIIDQLRAKGYDLVTLDQVLAP